MSYIIDIATAVPSHSVSNAELINFYNSALSNAGVESIDRKLNILSEKTKIKNRYSCIPDFNGVSQELFIDGNCNQSVERRTAIYKEKLMPLAKKAIDKIFLHTNVKPKEVTHLITVSCTGVFAPGFEFLVAEYYGMRHTEKLGLNFLGCYAAIKALKHADYIAQADTSACILIVCAELCSLHFTPSIADEDVLSNLLFADGAAAVLVVGKENKHAIEKITLHIDAVASTYIPHTLGLMTWNISSNAFNMHLSKHIIEAIGENIFGAVTNFLSKNSATPDFWAIHPGGVRIVEAVKHSLNLTELDIKESMSVLEEHGNMSSPTILFVLKRILDKLKRNVQTNNKNIFACAFGPGLNVEMLSLSFIDNSIKTKSEINHLDYAFQI